MFCWNNCLIDLLTPLDDIQQRFPAIFESKQVAKRNLTTTLLGCILFHLDYPDKK